MNARISINVSRIILALSGSLLLAGCGDKADQAAKVEDVAPAPIKAVISPQGIGVYRIGMSEAEILALPGGPYAKEESFLLNLPSGRHVEQVSYSNVSGDKITLQNGAVCAVRVYDGAARTQEGLGVGNSFGDFEKAYGAAAIMAADGQLIFDGQASVYDIKVDRMPAESNVKPDASAKVISLAVSTCEIEPE